ncbi:choline/carnitine O-acyltransferase [Streptomyces xiaopingdaonensis]|uniref:choline/carnitine O-acyltransferase n=1 Tax=Streptomyces xiaopingdaonensis TaxID=1565415 RepID=UPI00030A1BB8|nr:choline/carnitine O-acyltransferase [Streptomyces xiaopingdaonensis]
MTTPENRPTPEEDELNTPQDAQRPTFAHEDRLPRVPLPPLEQSCARFLEWCGPLLTADERAATEAEVAAFLAPGSAGRTLQAALEEYDATPGVHSWLDTFWPYRYLGRRDRIALNANFFFLFEETGEAQLDRAAGLVASAVGYKLRVDEERLPPVSQRGQPQTMEQHKHLFSTTRIPGTEQDTVRTPYTPEWPGPSTARHIVVFHRGGLFRLDVLGPDGTPYALDDLRAGLDAALEAGAGRPGAGGPGDTPAGHLTTMARAEWAAARERLRTCAPGNAEALDDLETALFCVSLEESAPTGTQHACDELLHGDRGNRWFDKALTFVVFADGTAGINVEHCELDGTTVLAFVDDLLGTPADEHSHASGARKQGTPPLRPLPLTLDEQLATQARNAAAAFEAYGAAATTRALAFEDFGSTTAKSLGCSPDAFVQLAFQLAHLRAKGRLGATYESIATRQWQWGRTEAMRVITPEIRRFVAAMDDPTVDDAGRREAFHAAARAHTTRAKQCQSGDAPEQHLWELELIAKRRPELGVTEQPSLYRTPGWQTMRSDYLSTSSAPSEHIQYFGFGSTSPQCIGVAYVLLPDRFHLYLSTPQTVAEQMHTFADRLGQALTELRTLLGDGG